MSKSMIESLVQAQFKALNAKDNKERLRYTIAGIKDGKFYDAVGTNYGIYDENAEDTVFIEDSDFELSRITSAKIKSVTDKMLAFFNETEEVKESTNDEVVETEAVEVEEVDEVVETEEVDFEAVEVACKKAIKKGNVKKASKLLAKLDGQSCYKKLAKKIMKIGE